MTRSVACLFLLLSFATGALAAPAVPPELKPWQDWVLHGNESVRCPFFAGDANQRQCAWPGQLELAADARGARFSFPLTVHAETWLTLPGDAEHWPLAVTANGRALPVVMRGNLPQARLAAGEYRVAGTLRWERRPESLRLGSASGLLALTVDGTARAALVDAQGRLWFGGRQAAPTDAGARNAVALRVFRRLADGVPPMLTSRLELDVSGEDREILLGRALPEGFAPVALHGGLPARLEPSGDLRLQARAGRWVVILEARQLATTQDYRIEPRTSGSGALAVSWPAQEIWTFMADHRLRTARLEGAPAIDPRQTGLPEEWQALPAWALGNDTPLTLVEQVRGDAHPQPEPLVLNRQLWLDFDGAGLTARDALSGQLERNGRLAFAAGVQPGRVTLNGEPQVITALGADGGQPGIEVRPGPLAVDAVSRMALGAPLPASGWARDVQELSATLQLPPGWTLFAASGVDAASPSWLGGWTLWDIFLVLVLTVAAFRLAGSRVAALMLATLLLTHDISGAPLLLWLNLVAVLAVWRVLPDGRVRAVVNGYRLLSAGLLAAVAVLFAVDQVRQGLYPELEYPWRDIHQSPVLAEAAPAGAMADAAMPEAMVMQEALEETDEVRTRAKSAVRANVRTLLGSGKAGAAAPLAAVDPSARAQTGPGVPDWSWRAVTLRWDGPVAQSQQMDLWLLSPPVNRTLCFLRVLLVAALFVALWRGLSLPRLPTAAAVGGFLLPALLAPTLWLATSDAQAAYPDAALLNDLRARLTAPPECVPACVAIEQANLQADGSRIALRLRVAAAARTAVPLPAADHDWQPRAVSLDGRPAPLARRDGALAVAVEPGVHEVLIEGSAAGVEALQFSFALPPGRVEAAVTGWQVAGVVDGRLPGGALSLRRDGGAARQAQPEKRLLKDPEPPFAIVTRQLRFDIDWQVETRIERVAPRSGPLTLALPLLPGERVTSKANVRDDKVWVALAQDQQQFVFQSMLTPQDTLQLSAPQKVAWVERWQLEAATRWHVEAQGIPPVKGAGGMQWHPWPGETLALAVSRPQAVAGSALTLEGAWLEHTPGHRAATTQLTLQLLSAEGGEYRFRLPEGALLEEIRVDGVAQVVAGDGREAVITLHPGGQRAEVRWRSDEGMGVVARTPALDLGREVSNLDVRLVVPHDRWPLLLGGPGAGPALLYWGVLLVVLLVGAALARLPHSPLKAYEWMLLGLGMSSTMLPWTLLVAAWFFVIAARARMDTRALSAGVFNFLQLMLAFFTLLAMGVLLTTIPQSLVLGTPDMQISGNGSQAGLLHWFLDRSAGVLPQGWLVSLPLWAYRLAMLAWSLWLALALTRWLRWAWQAYSAQDLWRTERPVVHAAPAREADAKVEDTP